MWNVKIGNGNGNFELPAYSKKEAVALAEKLVRAIDEHTVATTPIIHVVD